MKSGELTLAFIAPATGWWLPLLIGRLQSGGTTAYELYRNCAMAAVPKSLQCITTRSYGFYINIITGTY